MGGAEHLVFNSFTYMIFFPAVLLLYYAVPQKFKNLWLLIASYFFYACYSVKYVGILLVATLVTYLAALVINNVKTSGSDISHADSVGGGY